MENIDKEFIKTMKDMSLQEEFYAALKKKPEMLEKIDIRALIKRMGLLSDEERYEFRHILVYENLTKDEIKRFQKIYPERTGGGKFEIFFPKKENVEEHYKKYFRNGRK